MTVVVPDLPHFPHHRDPVASGSVRLSDDACECCGLARGVLFKGVIYASEDIDSLCPWCIADGSAAKKYDATFFDAFFCDSDDKQVDLPDEWYETVFSRTIGFSTFNPIGWWVHCNEPAEYIMRNEPYEMVFECRRCHQQQIILDYD